jgi:hypothetical protein
MPDNSPDHMREVNVPNSHRTVAPLTSSVRSNVRRICQVARGVSIVFALWLSSAPVGAASQVTVYYLDHSPWPKVRLDRLAPLTENLRAILAVYSLQAGTDCNGEKCILTSALGLGAQCSDGHISLILSHFETGIPNFNSRRGAAIVSRPDAEAVRKLCYDVPNTATSQKLWEVIRVTRNEEEVLIQAISIEAAHIADDAGVRREYRTKYRITNGAISIIENREFERRDPAHRSTAIVKDE